MGTAGDNEAWISLGSNLGDRAWNLREALRRIDALPRTSVAGVSGLYATEPVERTDQPEFLNAAAALHTGLGPEELLEELLGIERAMGRDRAHAEPKGPRPIDLDLLLFRAEAEPEAMVLTAPGLVLPHPAMARRRFVLEPLAEIAPALLHPTTGRTVRELLDGLGDPARVERLRGLDWAWHTV